MKRFRHGDFVNGDIAKTVLNQFWNLLKVFSCKLEHFNCVTRGTQHINRYNCIWNDFLKDTSLNFYRPPWFERLGVRTPWFEKLVSNAVDVIQIRTKEHGSITLHKSRHKNHKTGAWSHANVKGIQFVSNKQLY